MSTPDHRIDELNSALADALDAVKATNREAVCALGTVLLMVIERHPPAMRAGLAASLGRALQKGVSTMASAGEAKH